MKKHVFISILLMLLPMMAIADAVESNSFSLVFRPSLYYGDGGIEGVSVYTYLMPEEKNEKCNGGRGYHFFERVGEVYISDYGVAQYYVNPTNADLSNFSIDFYNWHENIKEPSATESTTPTRSGVAGGIRPVYTTTDELLKANPEYLKDGILSVPFFTDAYAIEANLKKGIGTIASLSMTRKGADGVTDITVNSNNALIVPEYSYGLLIGDNTFPVDRRHLDQIGYDGGAVNSSNLHRSFSFLALATTSPTHTIKYNGSFDITRVLESRYVPIKDDYVNEITDTLSYHNAHTAIARWNGTTLNKEEDSDASIDKHKVVTMYPELFKKLALRYEIVPVNYTLGSNKTGESVHLELIKNDEGHVIAYPRNVTADGMTITGQTANSACIGRQPIVCIMVKNADKIVSFAYMKFLITDSDVETLETKEVAFEIDDELWVNCADYKYDRIVTWSQIERRLLDETLGGMSKNDFDNNFVLDYYNQTTRQDEINNEIIRKVTRYGIQYDAKGGKRIGESRTFGTVVEEWNVSAQGIEDATTHILRWSFTVEELVCRAEELKKAGKLEDKGDYYANKEPLVTWVRYAHKDYVPETDAPAIGAAPEKGNPSIWVKLTIPAGAIRVAKGKIDANKILTFWYDLNSKTNATSTKDACEVRVNVPVPVPETSATVKTIGYSYLTGDPLDIRYDNLLEKANDPLAKRSNKAYTEFTKDLKDFFIDGKISASFMDNMHFNSYSIKGMRLGCEFVLPSTTIGNASFNAGKNHNINYSWTVKGYTGAEYTLILNADHTKIQIKAKDNTVYSEPVDLVTLNYDNNPVVADREMTVLNYVNGVDQDDILNAYSHNELGEREAFTAYINIKAVNACVPVIFNDSWFNVRFIRPLEFDDPKDDVIKDAPNNWQSISIMNYASVIDWRNYMGDPNNRNEGKDANHTFDFKYYGVTLSTKIADILTDANLGTDERNDNFTKGSQIDINQDAAYKAKLQNISTIPNFQLEQVDGQTIKYKNNSGINGGFHIFVPVYMEYVFGTQATPQVQYITIGVSNSPEMVAAKPGDANGDKEVNVSDIVEVVNYIMDNPSAIFLKANADLNDDGEVNVTDIVMMVDIIMSNQSSSTRMMSNRAGSMTDGDCLTIDDVTINAGETKQVNISLNNPDKKYTAFQFDLTLPKGITIAKNSNGKLMASLDTERKDDHTLSVSELGNNTYRLLAFSMSNAELYGNNGPLVNITIQADADMSNGTNEAALKSQVFTATDGTQYKWSDLPFIIQVNGSENTVINEILLNDQKDDLVRVYTLTGLLIFSIPQSDFSEKWQALPSGVYIVNGQKMIKTNNSK